MNLDPPRATDASDAFASGRRLRPELMDDPQLDPALHRSALAGLRRINRLSLAARPVWRSLRGLARESDRLSVLDLATGSGDVAIALWRRAKAAGVELEITALDASPVAVEAASRAAASAGAPLRAHRADVLADPLPGGHDVVMCSIFFHHLETHEAVALLGRMAAAARRRVVVSDLRRCAYGTLLAAVAPRLLTRSRVVHVDALRSARAAFTTNELATVAAEAGLLDARVSRHFPARMLLSAESPPCGAAPGPSTASVRR